MTKQTDIQTIRNDFLDLELTTLGAGYTTCSASNASPTVLEADMVKLEMVNKRGQVSFFTVKVDEEESFIKEMQRQDADWLVLSREYHD